MSGVPVFKLPDDDMQAAPATLVRAGHRLANSLEGPVAVVVVRDAGPVEEVSTIRRSKPLHHWPARRSNAPPTPLRMGGRRDQHRLS